MAPIPRDRSYQDPLDEIWIWAARRIGFAVARTADAYARTDGRGAILVGTRELLDGDDCLAQMILHELCHALVEGEDAWRLPDWGLDNTSPRDEAREHATIRLQAALAGAYGLRDVLAPTTEYRAYFDALPGDTLAGDALARAGMARARRAPFFPHLEAALAATARVVGEAARWAGAASLAALAGERHAAGFALRDGETCGTCVWRARGGCRQAAGVRVEAAWRACVRWEGALDCQDCGACCREAFGSVTVSRRDPVVRRHPELVLRRESYLEIAREGDRCAALELQDDRYLCKIYEDRPRCCRDLERGGRHCLDARWRVGLSC